MLPGLMIIATCWALKGSRSNPQLEGARRDHPACGLPNTKDVDGMLFVGVRPEPHRAA
jgi:hypothetical protein